MNDVHVFLRRGDAALAFLLEAVKDKHCFGELDGIHGTVGAANIVFHHLKHPGTAKALEHFGCIVLVTRLCQRQSEAEKPPNVRRQGHQVFVAATNPFKGLFVCGHD